jgi:sigma-B regulation protein RsbU (phosphoserine phosphatase)
MAWTKPARILSQKLRKNVRNSLLRLDSLERKIDPRGIESYSVLGMEMPTPNPPRHWWSFIPRPVLLTLAVILCAATIVYALVWIVDARHVSISQVEIGINQTADTFFDPSTGSVPIFNVLPGSPAESAGLRAGDQIVALNGHALKSYDLLAKMWSRSRPGDPVDVTVRRPGVVEPLTFHSFFRPTSTGRSSEGAARTSAREVLSFFPIFFVLVGFTVLFLRLEDPDAWLLACLFICFITIPPFNNHGVLPHGLQRFTFVFQTVFQSLIAPAFYVFFALFPQKSPLERRAPWLKWIALAVAAAQMLPGLASGHGVRLPSFVSDWAGDESSEHIRLAFTYTFVALGLTSLLWNCTSAESLPESRRKSRVLLAGTVVGVLPWILEHILMDFRGYRPPFWIDRTLDFLVLLYPLSFAYSIIKHRVLEIPVLFRRSLRYVLVQRGYFLLLFSAALLAIFLFSRVFSGLFAENSQFGMALSAAFGVAMVWVSGPLVKRGTDRIDRAFFRSSYDARVILQDLAEKTRTVSSRLDLARLLELHVEGALHPKSLACYLGAGNGNLSIERGTDSTETGWSAPSVPRPGFPFRFGTHFVPRDVDTVSESLPLLAELARNGKAWDVPPPASDQPRGVAALTPECLVPIVGRNNKLMGLLVLGPRLSEEPYSGEDKYLLESVAGQAAVSLENMSMAELIAERLELDRRAAREMQIARDVQSRLFPQVMPALASLEYAGACLQARQVGGDYYDFVHLDSGHLAFVLADISGKGIAGALLMASLQANLRSRYEVARDDLPRLLNSVNQFFYENTPDDRYATMFLGVYDDATRELTYANCGQNPPLVFRSDGSLERLAATATVIGLFPNWQCDTRTIVLQPNDVLVIYTDGVTEANDAGGNEFGEERMKQTVRATFERTAQEILTAIQDAVQKFSPSEQFDDLTLVVARAR